MKNNDNNDNNKSDYDNNNDDANCKYNLYQRFYLIWINILQTIKNICMDNILTTLNRVMRDIKSNALLLKSHY